MKELTKAMQSQFTKMSKSGKLFRSAFTGNEVWQMYLDSQNKIHGRQFRDPESSYYNCDTCKSFFRRYGNIVSMDAQFNIITMFDVCDDEEYKVTFELLAKALKEVWADGVFLEDFRHLQQTTSCKKTDATFKLGLDRNLKRYDKEESDKYGVVAEGEVVEFTHFSVTADKAFVNTSSSSCATIESKYKSARDVFYRTMEEIPLETLMLVKDLISQGSLLDGTTHLVKVKEIIKKKKKYDTLAAENKYNWAWLASHDFPYARFKNELIGTLCIELAEGVEINQACSTWNKRVDPVNYMKAKAPITANQIKEAKKYVEDNGYVDSFDRRLATITDIKVTEIKHINNEATTSEGVSIFDDVKATKTRHTRNQFKGLEEVTIDKFMADILPGCTSVEVYLEARHTNNVVSLTTAKKEGSKPIFKWGNNYSWTYEGNIAGHSQIKAAVKAAGGTVNGILNARLAWNSKGGKDGSDLDVWASEPDGTKIGFNSPYVKRQNKRTKCSGQLDVDNMDPQGDLAVENITWTDENKMQEGKYTIWVNAYRSSGSKGCTVELDIKGETTTFEHNVPIRDNENVKIAEVVLKDGKFNIKEPIPSTFTPSKDVHNLETNHFYKTSLVCLSPNHWGNNATGNKHFFFMLGDLKVKDSIVGFHTENVEGELAKHRKVIEALSQTCQIQPTKESLSGIGFNSTVKDYLIVKLKGNFQRTLKITF